MTRTGSAAQLALMLCLLIAIPSLFLGVASRSLHQTALVGLATLILVVSLYTFSGNSGVFSFGHLAMAMVGAYVGSIASMPPESKQLLYPALLPTLQHLYLGQVGAILAGGVAATLVGAVLALLLARMAGLTAGLATFVVLLIAFSLATGLESVTNGSSGLVNIPTASEVGQVLPWTLLAIVLAAAFQATRSCQRLRASREDVVAAASVGVRVHRERTIAFVFSSFLAGIGGAVYVMVMGTMSPSLFYLGLTTTVVAMLVIGGMFSLTGAVLGTVLIAALNEGMSRLEGGLIIGQTMITLPDGVQQVVVAISMLGILIVRPAGLMGGREMQLPLKSWRREGDARDKELKS